MRPLIHWATKGEFQLGLKDKGKVENFIVIPVTVFNKNLGKELLSPSFFRKIPY